MSEQLALVAVPAEVNLKPRQQAVLDALTAAGHDGLHADEAGAIAHGFRERWAHGPGDRCDYCGRDGQQILKRLRTLGLARYRRGTSSAPGYWQAIGTHKPSVMPRGMTDVIPF